MDNPFEPCWDRIRRAYAHDAAGARLWNAFLQSEPYSTQLLMRPDGAGVLTVTQDSPIPSELALELGEFLYQLRAALDGCVYQAAILENRQDPPPRAGELEFPVCLDLATFERAASKKLAGIGAGTRTVIESLQPYNAPQLQPRYQSFNFHTCLMILNEWARKDRHRKLHLTASLASAIDPLLAVAHVVEASLERVSDDLIFLKAGESVPIATCFVKEYSPGMRIHANPNLAIDLAVDEEPYPKHANDCLRIRGKGMAFAVEVVLLKVQETFKIPGPGIHVRLDG